MQHLKFGAYSVTHTGFSDREQEILHPTELPGNTGEETQWMLLWQSALHLLLTSLFSTDRILRWLLTEPSVKQVSLYIKHTISPKPPHTPWWHYGRQYKSALQLSLTSPPGSLRHISPPEIMEQWNQCTRTWKRKGCLATYSICLWPLFQSHWLGGVSNAAEHRQVGGIHALSSSRQEHRYLKSQALILALQHFHQSLHTRAGPGHAQLFEPCTRSETAASPWF